MPGTGWARWTRLLRLKQLSASRTRAVTDPPGTVMICGLPSQSPSSVVRSAWAFWRSSNAGRGDLLGGHEIGLALIGRDDVARHAAGERQPVQRDRGDHGEDGDEQEHGQQRRAGFGIGCETAIRRHCRVRCHPRHRHWARADRHSWPTAAPTRKRKVSGAFAVAREDELDGDGQQRRIGRRPDIEPVALRGAITHRDISDMIEQGRGRLRFGAVDDGIADALEPIVAPPIFDALKGGMALAGRIAPAAAHEFHERRVMLRLAAEEGRAEVPALRRLIRDTACVRSASSVAMPRCTSPRASRWVRTVACVWTLPRSRMTPAAASMAKIASETRSSMIVKPLFAAAADGSAQHAHSLVLTCPSRSDADAHMARIACEGEIERLVGAADAVEHHAELADAVEARAGRGRPVAGGQRPLADGTPTRPARAAGNRIRSARPRAPSAAPRRSRHRARRGRGRRSDRRRP